MTAIDEREWTAEVERFLDRNKSPRAEGDKIILATKPAAVKIAAPVLTSLEAKPYATTIKAAAYLRPQWNMVVLPYIFIDPAPALEQPVAASDFILWPVREGVQNEGTRLGDAVILDRPILTRPILIPPIRLLPQRQAFFIQAVPRLLDMSLTIRSTIQADGSIRITGGSVVMMVSSYAQDNVEVAERLRDSWATALVQAGYSGYLWKFSPVNIRSLGASLDLPAGHAAAPPEVSVNAGAGTATFVIELTEAGVLAWKTALEQRNGTSIPGICTLSGSYYVHADNRINTRDQKMSAGLGTLLASCGPETIRAINPQQTVDARVVVAGHELIQNVAISLRPNLGQAPAEEIFDRAGGQVSLSVTTQDVDSVEVDWSAQVTFASTSWPVIPTSGTLSKSSGWVEIVKPDSWVATYTIIAMLVDAAGKPVPMNEAGANYHVNGVLNFTAPYIPHTNILVSPFDLSNQAPLSVALPRFPGQPFGDLVLTLFATRNGIAGTQTRKLSPTELAVIVMIYPNATIEIKTANDSLPELSAASDILGMLERLV